MTDDLEEDSVDELMSELVSKAGSAGKSGDIQLAVALLSEAALADPGNETVGGSLFRIAQDYFYQKNYKAALPIFGLLRALFDEDLVEFGYVLFDSGITLVELGELDRGEVLLRAGLENDPENPWFLGYFGYFLLNQKKYEEGITILERAIFEEDSKEDKLDYLEAISWAELKLGRKKEALQVLLGHLDFYLDRIINIYLRIVRLMDDQPAIDALKRLEKNLWQLEVEEQSIESALDYLSDDYYYELARRYLKLGKKEEALLSMARFVNSKNPTHLLGFGRVLLDYGVADVALDYANQAAAQAPEDPFPDVLRAKAFLAKKDYPAALQASEKGLSLAMENLPKTIREEPGLYTTEKFTTPNLKEVEEGQKRKENDPRPELFLAKVDALTGLEQYEAALQTLDQAINHFPKEIIFYRYAAALLLKVGKPEEALAIFSIARKARVSLDTPSKNLIKKIKTALPG